MCLTTRPCTIITLLFRGQNNTQCPYVCIWNEMDVHFVKKLLNLPIQFILGKQCKSVLIIEIRLHCTLLYTVWYLLVHSVTVRLCLPLSSKCTHEMNGFCYCFAFVSIHSTWVVRASASCTTLSWMSLK